MNHPLGYDQRQRHAAHWCLLCCRREVFSTHPEAGCPWCPLAPQREDQRT